VLRPEYGPGDTHMTVEQTGLSAFFSSELNPKLEPFIDCAICNITRSASLLKFRDCQ
jgi:hypothetical protein